ncbi:MAG: hypothetical protein KGJ07_07120 [Patescibacteria group bacterium]|nr:hypothetical protein [Patescibacteria group bacterium]
MKEEEKKVIRVMPYTTKQLSVIYNVDRRTFYKWLNDIKNDLGKRNGYYWSIPQVKMIFQKLSLPANILLEP